MSEPSFTVSAFRIDDQSPPASKVTPLLRCSDREPFNFHYITLNLNRLWLQKLLSDADISSPCGVGPNIHVSSVNSTCAMIPSSLTGYDSSADRNIPVNTAVDWLSQKLFKRSPPNFHTYQFVNNCHGRCRREEHGDEQKPKTQWAVCFPILFWNQIQSGVGGGSAVCSRCSSWNWGELTALGQSMLTNYVPTLYNRPSPEREGVCFWLPLLVYSSVSLMPHLRQWIV